MVDRNPFISELKEIHTYAVYVLGPGTGRPEPSELLDDSTCGRIELGPTFVMRFAMLSRFEGTAALAVTIFLGVSGGLATAASLVSASTCGDSPSSDDTRSITSIGMRRPV